MVSKVLSSRVRVTVMASVHVDVTWQDYRIGTARKMSVDIDATPDLLLLIQQKLRIMHDTVVFPVYFSVPPL